MGRVRRKGRESKKDQGVEREKKSLKVGMRDRKYKEEKKVTRK